MKKLFELLMAYELFTEQQPKIRLELYPNKWCTLYNMDTGKEIEEGDIEEMTDFLENSIKPRFCEVRKGLDVPYGDQGKFLQEGRRYQYKWVGDDEDVFKILVDGIWEEAYSIDFDF